MHEQGARMVTKSASKPWERSTKRVDKGVDSARYPKRVRGDPKMPSEECEVAQRWATLLLSDLAARHRWAAIALAKQISNGQLCQLDWWKRP